MYIMIGCPGSGKTTWAYKTAEATKAVIVSADHYFINDGKYQFDVTKLGKAHAECFRNATLLVQNGFDCIVDNTNSTRSEISPYYQLAKAYDYKVVLVRVLCDISKAVKRNVHGVPFDKIYNIALRCAGLSIPSYWDVKIHKVKG